MKHVTFLFIAFAFDMAVFAQPTLTLATNAPIAGNSYMLNYGPYVSPGASGANQTWDLQALMIDSTTFVQLVQSAETPNGAQFPTSTVAEINPAVTQYFTVDASGIHFAGSDDGESVIVHAPQGTYLPFPCTYGTTWSSEQNATFTYDDMEVVRTGNFSGTVDGYGTLLMPNATIPNVLRVQWTHTLQDVMGFFTISYVYNGTAFFVAGHSHPIAELVTASVDLGGGPTSQQFSRWTDELSTGVREEVAADLKVYPNPASDEVSVEWPVDLGGPASITVFDMTGRVVLQKRLNGMSAKTARIDVSSLFPGIYNLALTSTDSRRSTVPLIVE